MQIMINVPDGIPTVMIEEEVKEFEHKLRTLSNQLEQQVTDSFEVDKEACLTALKQLEQGDLSNMTEIGDIDEYIENLQHEIN